MRVSRHSTLILKEVVMATNHYVVTGDQLLSIFRKWQEIVRQLILKNGSPLKPHLVSWVLQILSEPEKEIVEFTRDDTSPGQIMDPLLLIGFKPDAVHPDGYEWQIDVEGKIGLYILKGESLTYHDGKVVTEQKYGLITHDFLHLATPFMRSIVEQLKKNGRKVKAIGMYTGSFGPSHILRQGILFQRVGINLNTLNLIR